MVKKCKKIDVQEPQRNRNATAIFFQFNKDQYCTINCICLQNGHRALHKLT